MSEPESTVGLWKRRAVNSALGVLGLVLVSTVVYHVLMITVEGASPSPWHSLQIVVETYTGTGFGSDAPWESPVLNVFVAVMDLSTFLIVFIILPYLSSPFIEEAFRPSVSTSTDLTDHVVVCGLDQQGTRLLDELEALDIAYAVVTADRSAALELEQDGRSVVHGDLASVETLRGAGTEDARAIVVDTEDEHTASVVLAIREINPHVPTVVLVNELEYEDHLRYAGADEVLTPRHLLGRRLAERVTSELRPLSSDVASIGDGPALLELTVPENSSVCGSTIQELEQDADGLLSVVGIIEEGTFVPNPAPETPVEPGAELVLVGDEGRLRALEDRAHQDRGGEARAVVAGHGEVGSTVVDRLDTIGIDCTVVDVEDRERVDVVGDATEEAVLTQANVQDAGAFVLTIADDDDAILSVLVASQTAEGVIMARLNEPGNEVKIRRAGADYVLTLPTISGRMIAREVLHERILSYDRQLTVVRIAVDELREDASLQAELDATGCAVVAVEREDELETHLSGDLELRSGDRLIVVGSDKQVDEFRKRTSENA